jgi:hypothetical protein
MKVRLRRFALALTLTLPGCFNPSVPPVSGAPPDLAVVIGGPDLPGGGGTVPLEIRVGGAVTAGSTLDVSNETRPGVTGGTVSVVAGDILVFMQIGGDVGDTLKIVVRPLEGHPIRYERTVPAPRIADVHDPDGTSPIVHSGESAALVGEGFSVVPEANLVSFDGLSAALVTGTSSGPRPSLLLFTVPPGHPPGAYPVVVTVAGYSSEEFLVEIP